MRPGAGAPSIGEPVVNMQLYVLDAELREQPLEVVGELFIGGAQVAKGYLDEALTEERFVAWAADGTAEVKAEGPTLWPTGPCWEGRRGPEGGPEWAAHSAQQPAAPGARLYRTGDLARFTEQGCLEFLGRADSQARQHLEPHVVLQST